jgi:hypothetical protein
MQRLHWYLGSLLLGAALIAPVGMKAITFDDQHNNCTDKDSRGYYDRGRKECHSWDAREDRAYQKWQSARHKTHREFSKLKAKEQSKYWQWRREHPDDNDQDRH